MARNDVVRTWRWIQFPTRQTFSLAHASREAIDRVVSDAGTEHPGSQGLFAASRYQHNMARLLVVPGRNCDLRQEAEAVFVLAAKKLISVDLTSMFVTVGTPGAVKGESLE